MLGWVVFQRGAFIDSRHRFVYFYGCWSIWFYLKWTATGGENAASMTWEAANPHSLRQQSAGVVVIGYFVIGYFVIGYFVIGYFVIGYFVIGYFVIGYFVIRHFRPALSQRVWTASCEREVLATRETGVS